MKLNKTKAVILVLLAVVFVLGVIFGVALSAVIESEDDISKTSEGVTEFVFSPGTQKELELKVGESKKGYITLKGDFNEK